MLLAGHYDIYKELQPDKGSDLEKNLTKIYPHPYGLINFKIGKKIQT